MLKFLNSSLVIIEPSQIIVFF